MIKRAAVDNNFMNDVKDVIDEIAKKDKERRRLTFPAVTYAIASYDLFEQIKKDLMSKSYDEILNKYRGGGIKGR